MAEDAPDAVIVGSGPNGLAAGVALARAGRSVVIYEAKSTVGGGTRTEELTRPGFVHDVCSAVHPTAVISPFFRTLPLEDHGLEWVYPPASLAHPLDDGSAAVLEHSIEETAATLGPDGASYRALMEPLVRCSEALFEDLLAPLRIPRHPFSMLRFGWHAWRSAVGLACGRFRGPHARALFAGNAGHTFLPLDRLFTAAMGLILSIAGHRPGWPHAKGGTAKLSGALASYFESLGGTIVREHPVRSLRALPRSRVVLLDVTPKQVLELAGEDLPPRYRKRLRRYRYGPAAFKVDWALRERIPWTASTCQRVATVHVGGTMDEIAAAESALWTRSAPPERPFVLVAQPSVSDPSRAPEGMHTGWAYAHVPHGCDVDMTEAVEAQIERFAPGFKDCILERHTMSPAQFEAYNANNVGGHIIGGVSDIAQLYTRPVARLNPYTTPNPRLFLCSASTPPGGGVHGMGGYFAAQAALRRLRR